MEVKRTKFAKNAGIGSALLVKLSKGTSITTDLLLKIFKYLKCAISDIIEVVNDETYCGEN